MLIFSIRKNMKKLTAASSATAIHHSINILLCYSFSLHMYIVQSAPFIHIIYMTFACRSYIHFILQNTITINYLIQ